MVVGNFAGRILSAMRAAVKLVTDVLAIPENTHTHFFNVHPWCQLCFLCVYHTCTSTYLWMYCTMQQRPNVLNRHKTSEVVFPLTHKSSLIENQQQHNTDEHPPAWPVTPLPSHLTPAPWCIPYLLLCRQSGGRWIQLRRKRGGSWWNLARCRWQRVCER